MQRNKFLAGTLIGFLVLVISATAASATLTLDATSITSDAAMTLTTASGSNVTVTRGVGFASATSTDSLYVGGLTQLTAATASGTALVIGGDVPLFRSAANTMTLQGTLTVTNGFNLSAGTLAVTAGGTFNAATTTDSLYVGGLTQLTAATASGTALVIGGDVPLFRSAANTMTLQGTLTVTNGFNLSAGTLAVTAGGTFNAATTTDSLYVGGLTQLTAATASGTALVIGGDVPLFRSAANTMTLQGTLTVTNGFNLSAGTLAVTAGGTFNAATTTDSLYVGGLTQLTAATASGTALVIGGDVPMYRGGQNTLALQGNASLTNGALIYGDTGTVTACAAGAAVLDLSTGNFFTLDMAGVADCTITFAGGLAGGIYVIELEWSGANAFLLADTPYHN